ncbi:ImmA/IrrE family metallo-endopeptidase [Kytococcus sedentarius]|uniref:ImmA/IrrE family metallo-endopeptidase n=1 Tax=Kytococcus sedentarius TaxID=1276 RepID=UPI00387A393B
MHTPHPWRDLRDLRDLTLHWRRLPWPVSGCTDGERVWLHDGLSQVERRCVLAHELEHVRRGHREAQPAAVEREVRRAVAAYLLPDLAVVAGAMAWAHARDEAAEELWVTPAVLQDRLEGLTEEERAWMGSRFPAP